MCSCLQMTRAARPATQNQTLKKRTPSRPKQQQQLAEKQQLVPVVQPRPAAQAAKGQVVGGLGASAEGAASRRQRQMEQLVKTRWGSAPATTSMCDICVVQCCADMPCTGVPCRVFVTPHASKLQCICRLLCNFQVASKHHNP